jgi:hypothetical protein
MANKNNVPSPVLPVPPLEYDVRYMNTLVRVLTYYIQQQDNPGIVRGVSVELANNIAPNPDVVIDTLAYNSNVVKITISALPTSATGLDPGQIWNDSGTLKIV